MNNEIYCPNCNNVERTIFDAVLGHICPQCKLALQFVNAEVKVGYSPLEAVLLLVGVVVGVKVVQDLFNG